MRSILFKNKIIRHCLIFLVFFSIFFLIHLSAGDVFFGVDPYYHAKHSLLIGQTKNLTLVEPWLEFHFFNYALVDPWWGYHLLLAVFIYFFGSFLGAKILSAILAALAFLIFYFVLNKFKASKPFFWTFLFFCSSSLLQYRLILERPHLLAMSVSPLVFFLIVKKKYYWLFFLSLIYTLFYNLSPLIIIIAVFGLSVEFYFSKKINLKIIISSIGGILVGIIIHPNSLNYCYVMFIHFWQVLYLKFSGIPLGIGGELHILSFAEFLRGHFLNLLFFAIAIALFAAFKKIRVNKYCLIINSLFLISCFWFLVALFVPRGIEYWCPFAWLFIALIFSFFAKTIEFNQIKKFIKEKINFKILLFFVHSFIIILVFYNFSQIFYHIYQKNNNNPDYYFQQANKWLKQNTEKNSIIFYNNWSFWPRMFFYNHYNHYIIGMDPTFLYEYDSELALIWRNISYHGIYCNQQDICMDLSPKAKINYISQTIKNNFKANYIITKNNPKLFLVKILANKKNDFKKVYENKGLLIYQITIP